MKKKMEMDGYWGLGGGEDEGEEREEEEKNSRHDTEKKRTECVGQGSLKKVDNSDEKKVEKRREKKRYETQQKGGQRTRSDDQLFKRGKREGKNGKKNRTRGRIESLFFRIFLAYFHWYLCRKRKSDIRHIHPSIPWAGNTQRKTQYGTWSVMAGMLLMDRHPMHSFIHCLLSKQDAMSLISYQLVFRCVYIAHFDTPYPLKS